MIAYSARLDAPRELVQHVARLLRAEHRAMGIRSGARTSTCFHQAILALVRSRKGADKTTLDAWYSGKHRDFGANIQTVTRPDGLPAWASDAMPGHLHDLISPNGWTSPGPPTGAASKLGLPTRATKALARASALGTSSPPTAAGSRSATAPPMPPFDRCDASGDAAPRFSSVFGGPCVTAQPAHDRSAIASTPLSTSPTSNAASYRSLAGIKPFERNKRVVDHENSGAGSTQGPGSGGIIGRAKA